MENPLGILAVTGPDGHWRPGIGDPTFMGWFTVAAYLACVVLCARAARNEPRVLDRSSGPMFWHVLAVILLFLGINKQLDLQSAITDLGRTLSKSQNWYAARRSVQGLFIATIAVSGVVGMLAFGWFFRRAAARYHLAIAGLFFLVAFVMIRAASFHNFDAFIRDRIFGMKWNWILELGGIALIAASAISCLRSPRSPRPSSSISDQGHQKYRIPGR